MTLVKIGAIASGSGSNFEAIIKATEEGILKNKAKVVVLICNKPGALCMKRAKNFNIPYYLIESDKHKGTREEFDKKLVKILKEYSCDLIVLVGYMRLVSQYFLDQFKGNVMNIHPALLPSFKGMHAQRDAVEYGVKVSGCTVHFVDHHSDHGPIIIQKCVPAYDTDTEDTLGARNLKGSIKFFQKQLNYIAMAD